MYVRHAQKIAKLFFSVRCTQFLFKLNILFKKKYINLLGPKTLRVIMLMIRYARNSYEFFSIRRFLSWMLDVGCWMHVLSSSHRPTFCLEKRQRTETFTMTT